MIKKEKIRNILKNIYCYSENIKIFNLYIDKVSKNKNLRKKMSDFVYYPTDEFLYDVKINYCYADEKHKFNIFTLHFKDVMLEIDIITIAEKLSLVYRKKIDEYIHTTAVNFDYNENDIEFDEFFNKYIDLNPKKREELDNLVKIENMYSVFLYDKCIKNKNMKILFDNLYNVVDGKSFFLDKVDLISDLFVKYYATSKECQDVLYSDRENEESKKIMLGKIYAEIEKKMLNNGLGNKSESSESSRKRM